ncbi:unnamed protein product [Ectocarpus sp. 4 AP-2014]
MRSPGVTPVLFGACLASAGVRECSCFTASLRVSTEGPAAAAAPAYPRRPIKMNSTKNSSGRPARFSPARKATARGRPSSAASSPTAAAAVLGDGSGDVSSSSSQGKPSSFKGNESTTRRRRRQRQRRPTLLAGGRGSPTTAEQQQPQPPQVDAEGSMTTSQQLSAEVSARRSRSRAWRLVGFPPVGFYDSDNEGLTSSSSSPLVGEDTAAGTTVADATDNTLRGRYREEHRDWQEKLERLVDMSEPPPELLAAAETKSIGDIIMPRPPPSKSLEEGGQQRQERAEDGVWTSRAMLAGAAMLYGTNFGCVKLLEESVPMSLAAALRFSVALVPFVPFLKKVNPGVFRAGAEVGLLNAIGYWAQSESLMTTTASKSAFICSLAVVFVPLLDALLGGDKKDSPKAAQEKAAGGGGGGVFAAMNGPWFPALLAAAGVACLELIGVEGGPNSGDVWALVQPLW